LDPIDSFDPQHLHNTMRNSHLATAFAAMLAFCLPAFAGEKGPPTTGSDDCATPHAIAGTGTFPVDMTAATTSFVMPQCLFFFPENDVWFAWTADTTGTAIISLCSLQTADTNIAVWTNADPCMGAGTTLVCNDNFCSVASRAQLAVTSGTTYIIQVGVFKQLGVLTSMEISIQGLTPPTKFCRGDGTGTTCPCNNSSTGVGTGCANSTGSLGAGLDFGGTPSVSLDSLVLTASGMPATATALFFQGTAQIDGGLGTPMGDGLHCVGGTIIRLGVKTATGGIAAYPGASTPISVKGMVASGNVRNYQVRYRDAPTFCTADTFNSTNGVRVTWAP
jgi:hypothetical protein